MTPRVLLGLTLAGACAGARPAEDAGADAPRYGFGRQASEAEIAALAVSVRPNGTGLPAGSGSVAHGARVYAARCAACHGATGTEGPFHILVGTEPSDFSFGDDPALLGRRTIGNYWQYVTTLFDYTRRAMPFDRPGSLTDDEVYAVTAWMLWRNRIVPEDAVLDAASLAAVRMPARDRFVPDTDLGVERQ